METINTILRYIGYSVVAITIGICSSFDTHDFIYESRTAILTVLVTATVLTTTLTNLLISELFKNEVTKGKDKGKVIKNLRRNSMIEVVLLALSFVFLSTSGILTKVFPTIAKFVPIATDSLLAFDFLYFLLVLWDEMEGWYKLLINEND